MFILATVPKAQLGQDQQNTQAQFFPPKLTQEINQMMPQEQAPEPKETPEAPEQETTAGMMVPAAALGQQGLTAKPGDTLSFTVTAVHGDMLELSPAEDDEEGDDMPSADAAKKMPMDELENSLPTAER